MVVCAPCLVPYAASTVGALYAVKKIDKTMSKKKKKKTTQKKKKKLKGGRTRKNLRGRTRKNLKGGYKKRKKNILNDYLMNGGNLNALWVEHI